MIANNEHHYELQIMNYELVLSEVEVLRIMNYELVLSEVEVLRITNYELA
ncbi:MAG: hypothetical protein KME21_08225 [Desmonostoc vinosum HA7617-LM4]|nr:hypothetical protein [Desmonostoc vinosum HA7617-LM4]